MRLILNTAVTTTTPTLVIDGDLPAGTHRVQLVVVDRQGRQSQPASVTIVVIPSQPR